MSSMSLNLLKVRCVERRGTVGRTINQENPGSCADVWRLRCVLST